MVPQNSCKEQELYIDGDYIKLKKKNNSYMKQKHCIPEVLLNYSEWVTVCQK